jgi:hypothetical protein
MVRLKPAVAAIAILVLLPLIVLGQEARPQPAPPAAEPVDPPDSELVVDSGTVLPIVLTAYLNSRSTQPGDRLYAEVSYPVWVHQHLVIPRGSIIRGTVTEVARPGRIKGKGRMSVRFDDVLLPNGVIRQLAAGFRGIHGPGEEKVARSREAVEMDSSNGDDVGQIVGTGASGAVIGAIANSGGRLKGAAVGGGIGAGVGLATVLFSRGRELILEPGTQFDIELRQPLRFAFGEVDFPSAEWDGGRRYDSARPQRNNRDQNRNPLGNSRRRIGIPSIWP